MEYRKFYLQLNQTSPVGSTHKGYGGGIVWIGTDLTQLNGYTSVAMTPEEIIDFNKPFISDQDTIISIKRLLKTLTINILTGETTTQEQIDDLAIINDYWNPNKLYKIGDVFRYEMTLYETIQQHTSQSDWLPPLVPALYKIKTPPGIILEWVQPTGVQDAYNIGDKVKHDGFTWINNTASNVWEPGVYGWTQL